MDKKIYGAFVQWKAKMLGPNDPKDDDDFCRRYKIEKSDIVSFVSNPDFEDDLLIATLNWAKARTPQLIHAIYKEVKGSSNVADLEKFLNLVWRLKEKDTEKKGVTNYNFFNSLPGDVYNRIIEREARGIVTSGSEQAPELLPASQ